MELRQTSRRDEDRHVTALHRLEDARGCSGRCHQAGHDDVDIDDGSVQGHLLVEGPLGLPGSCLPLSFEGGLHRFFLGWLGNSVLATPLGGLAGDVSEPRGNGRLCLLLGRLFH